MAKPETSEAQGLRPNRPMTTIAPRALREGDAAKYVGFSSSYLRNQRVADMRKVADGRQIDGPRWINFGVAVRYLLEDLDAWIDSHRPDGGQRELS